MGRIWHCHFGPVPGCVNSQSHVVPFGIAPTCSFLDGGDGPVWDGWEASDAREFYANRWSVGPIRLGIGLRCPIFGLPIWVCTVTAVPAYAWLSGPAWASQFCHIVHVPPQCREWVWGCASGRLLGPLLYYFTLCTILFRNNIPPRQPTP